jgi:tetratricopeptide (TPR) repeat protein
MRNQAPRFSSIIAIVIILAGCATVATAENKQQDDFPSFYADSALTQTILAGIDLTIRERYDDADSIFTELEQRFPKSPVGTLFRAATLQAEMLDREDDWHTPRAKALIEEAIDKAETWRNAQPLGPEPLFFQAVAYGYYAVHEAQWGGWFSALKKGLKAANRFKEIIELDPEFYDAYVGLGNYYYFKSAKMAIIRWLPFVGDDREKGIKFLYRAVEKGTLTKTTARASLITVLLDFGLNIDAYDLAHELHSDYPESKAFLWGIGKASFATYRWEECIASFDSLEARYVAEGGGNYYNLIECAYHKFEAAMEAGEYERARAECRRAFSYPAPEKTRKRLKNHLEELEDKYRELGKYTNAPDR